MFRKIGIGLAVFAAVAGSTPAAAAAPGPADQLRWVIAASDHPAALPGQLPAHVSTALLAEGGGPAAVGAGLAELGRLSLRQVVLSQPDSIEAVVDSSTGAAYLLRLSVDRAGLVSQLRLTSTPARDAPQLHSWSEIDRALTGLGARVSFVTADVDPSGDCRPVHGLDADMPRPLGSAFKLYVLGALGQAVAERRAAWNEPLAIRADWKSWPSGTFQLLPAGTPRPLSDYADHMIAISDNTAADHLIHRLGRAAVERQLTLFGNREPWRDIPFPTTKSLAELKADDYPQGADAYLALSAPARAAALAAADELPLPPVGAAWSQPRDIDTIEWFASPMDICRAFAGLRRLDQPQIDHALSINDSGLPDRTRFPVVWFKGGSEPGVLTLSYLARSTTGRTVVTSLLISDPAAALPEDAVVRRAAPIIRGALQLGLAG